MTRPLSNAVRFKQVLAAAPRTPEEARPWLGLVAQFRRLGWDKSARLHHAVDMSGAPIPWFTYPATNWLDRVLRHADRVFEYGSGGSMSWFAERCATVVSVEHDHHYAELITSKLKPNITLVAGEELARSGYSASLPAQKRTCDVVVVDGLDRASALLEAFQSVDPDALVVLDASDRDETRDVVVSSSTMGSARIDFFGPRPGLPYFPTTSVFVGPQSSRLSPATVPEWSG